MVWYQSVSYCEWFWPQYYTFLNDFLSFLCSNISSVLIYSTTLPNTICKKGQDLKRDREIHKRENENTKTEMLETGENIMYSTESQLDFNAFNKTQLGLLCILRHLPDKFYATMLKCVLRIKIFSKWWLVARILGMVDVFLNLFFVFHILTVFVTWINLRGFKYTA